jgi:hypothetical protein
MKNFNDYLEIIMEADDSGISANELELYKRIAKGVTRKEVLEIKEGLKKAKAIIPKTIEYDTDFVKFIKEKFKMTKTRWLPSYEDNVKSYWNSWDS